jgi:alpha-1,6-mannosyltransferase
VSGRLALSSLRRWHGGRPWATNVSLCGLGFALVCLTRQFVSENDHFTIGFSGASGWSAAVYVAAVFVILTQPVNRYTFGIIIAFAVACRLVPLFGDPFLSSDIYRYVWDGIVQHAHINPYRYVPGDQALAFLRAPNQDVFDSMNRRDYARTIYPPVAQMIYFAVTWISPTVEMMKTAMIGFECVAVGAIVGLLRLMGRPREQALLYAWCPLLVWEIGGSGHVDAAVIAFVALALLFRARGSNVLTGLFLGLAIMTKFYPLVLLPALYRRGDGKMPATVAAVIAVGYSVYASAGKLVFGFLSGYTKEEGLVSGVRYFLLQWVQSFRALRNTSTMMYMVFCALVFAAIAVWTWIYATKEVPISRWNDPAHGEPPAFLRASAMFSFALMLLFSPHYPWYVVWLIPFFALAPNLPLMVYLLGVFYLFTTDLADPGPKMFLLNRILYGSMACAFVLHFVLQRWPVHRWLNPTQAGVVMPELQRD